MFVSALDSQDSCCPGFQRAKRGQSPIRRATVPSRRPCLWNGASWRAGGGRVRTEAVLNSLRGMLMESLISDTTPFPRSSQGLSIHG